MRSGAAQCGITVSYLSCFRIPAILPDFVHRIWRAFALWAGPETG